MKKIYSILLMAVALLISTNLKAVDVASYDQLIAALNGGVAGTAETTDITLTGNIELGANQALHMYRDTNDVVNLNLGGFRIYNNATKDYTKMFSIYRGTLNISNGTIENNRTATVGDYETLSIFGSKDPDVLNHTTVNILEGATIIASGCEGGKAITINELREDYAKLNGSTTALFNHTSTVNGGDGFAEGVHVNIYGAVTGTQYCVKVNGNVRSATYFKTLATPVTSYTSNEFAVKTVNMTDEATFNKLYAKAPIVHIYNSAVLNADANRSDATAVYSSGFGNFVIEGTVSGSTAVYVKSGNVTIHDANISSTGNYTAVTAHGKSGVHAGGSAVVIESNSSYTGESSLTVSGDSKITSTNGYAIEETITNAASTKVSSISIEGGTISGGSKGAIVVTDATAATDSVKVYGGNITGSVIKDNNGNPIVVTNPGELSSVTANSTYYTEIIDPETHKTTIVITTGEQPAQQTTFDITDFSNTGRNIELDVTNATTPFSVSGSVLATNGDMTLGDVILKGSDAQSVVITVNEGNTLTVNKLTMNNYAQVVVKAGAKFIVKGNQGIVAPSVNNIIIEAEDGNMGLFYFNPAVSSNKHPNATVQLYSNGYLENGVYHFQRFGVPVFTSLSHSQMTRKYSTITHYYYWDNTINDWAPITSATYEMKPFVGLTMTSTYGSAGNIYSMPGELYGNVNAELNYLVGWNYFANSYTGQMDIKDLLLDILNAHNDEIEGGVQIYDAVNDTWNAISKANIQEGTAAQTKIEPMQAIVLKNISDATITNAIDYENVLWNHRDELNETSAAPARRGASANYDLATIVISNDNAKQTVTLRQGAQFSNEFDNGYDLSKYMYGAVNVYAETANGNMAQVASDNIYGQTITVNTNSAKSFKMTFENLNGATFAIRDNVTGSVIDMTENAEYYFTADAYNGENRFEIVEARKMPTDVEVVDAAKAQKGIYSLVGAYLGEDFDVLPAGIYVVNGVKVVK